MSKKKSNPKQKQKQKGKISKQPPRNMSDIYALVLIGLALLVFIFVFTSATGLIGKYINKGLQYGMGAGRYFFAFFLGGMGSYFLLSKAKNYNRFATGLALVFMSLLALVHTYVELPSMFKASYLIDNGGILGALFAYSFKYLLGAKAAYVIFFFVLAGGLMFLSSKSLTDLIHIIRGQAFELKERTEEKKPLSEKLTQKVEALKKVSVNTKSIDPEHDFESIIEENKNINTENATVEISPQAQDGQYQLPPLSMFSTTKPVKNSSKKSVKENIAMLDRTLRDFDVDAGISKVVTGPTVTRYEIQLASGVKVNRILSLADDIALAFASPDVRILAPIPGKSAIGIEVPNSHRELVTIGDILSTEKMQTAKSLLTIAIGKDISGEPIIADLAAMPHLLIAGATGSGKSVCINGIITTLLTRATPEQVKLILIDPKRVELSFFNDIPHLLTPVVVQPRQASNALEWAVSEMENRYEILAGCGVKNITGYNALMEKKGGDKMPLIVVVIDELADLMMVASREVEDAICRLAQLARAIGIHLVIATQRPSTDVITGLIKANITNRIAFAVSSQIDSRVILDSGGAEKLIGKGDLLMSTPQSIKPRRVQAAFIGEKEIEGLVNYLKDQATPTYVTDITSTKKTEFNLNDFEDELYEQAVEIVVNSLKASVSYLQRRLRIGYGRAARLMDMLEDRGVVGPQEGSKPREILMTAEELTSTPIDD